MASSVTTYRIVTLTTSTPYNFVSGTTAAASGSASPSNKGCEITFQNQSTAATNVYIGGNDLLVAIGAAATSTGAGILLAQNGSYSFGKRDASSAVNMNDWYVISTSSNAICVAQLIKAV